MDPHDEHRLRNAPKAELHLHLEGALRWSTVRTFHPDGARLPETPPWLADPSGFRSFDDFRDVFLKVLRPATGTLESIERHVHDMLADLAAQGIAYVEPITGPRFHMGRGLALKDVLDAIDRGRRSAEDRTGIRARFLFGLNRHYAPDAETESFLDALAIAGPAGSGLLAGVDLQGDDRLPGHPAYARAFAAARERGLRVRVHAGEFGGPASVRYAVDDLGAGHLSHGIGAAEDPGLVRELADRGVFLHVCPTSNVRLGAVSSYAEHPLRRLLEAGCRVTLGTDDPLLFGASLVDEYRRALTDLGLSWTELARVAHAGFDAALLPEADRRALGVRAAAVLAGADGGAS